MGKEFEIRHDTTVNATPQQIWDTIATGPGISSWFIGRTTIDNGTVHTDFGGIAMPPSTITDNQPPTHFAHHSGHTPDGRYIANEFLIEARDHSATTLRTVASGFLPGDDWTDEYEAMRYGTEMFFATLDQTLHHFPGRTATPVTVFGPQVTDWPHTWSRLYDALGLTETPHPGDTTTNGAKVYFTNPHT
jgi:hypothetical protein